MQAAAAITTRARKVHRALTDLAEAAEQQRKLVERSFPEVYAIVAHGNCMEPELKSGAPIVANSTVKPKAGDAVIVHFRQEHFARYGFEAWVKRLAFDFNTAFPWDWDGRSDIMPVLVVESLNPPRRYRIPFDHIQAVHKVVAPGVMAADGSVSISRRVLEAA